MKCIICAADYASSSCPKTANYPKLLLKDAEKTRLDILMESIDSCNLITEYILVTNERFLSDFKNWSKSSKFKITIMSNGNTSALTSPGIVKDVKLAIKRQKVLEDVFVIGGDVSFDFELSKFIIAARRLHTSCVAVCSPQISGWQDFYIKINDAGFVESLSKTKEDGVNGICCSEFMYFGMTDVKLISQWMSFGCGVDSLAEIPLWLLPATKIYAIRI